MGSVGPHYEAVPLPLEPEEFGQDVDRTQAIQRAGFALMVSAFVLAGAAEEMGWV